MEECECVRPFRVDDTDASRGILPVVSTGLLRIRKRTIMTPSKSLDPVKLNNLLKQECITVGCIPAARCPYPGGCTWSGGVPGLGVYLVWGVYLVPGVVPGLGGCTWSRGMYLVWGVCTWSGVIVCPFGMVLGVLSVISVVVC